MDTPTQKRNVAKFNNDVVANNGYLYTTNARYSSVVANRRMTEAIVALVPEDARSIIDIGCGDGTYTGELANHFHELEIVGVDAAGDAIARAQRLFPGASFVVGDLLAPATLPQRIFDVGILRGVIHHLPDGAQGLINAALICRQLIIIEPNGNNPILKWIEQHSQYHREHEEQSFTSRELEAWCLSAGYRQIAIDYIGFIPMFFPTVPARIIRFFQPLLEYIYPIKKYFAAQIVLSCDNRLNDGSADPLQKAARGSRRVGEVMNDDLRWCVQRLIAMHGKAKVGHLGGNLSCIACVCAMMDRLGHQDRFVLSKGHSAGALYVALVRAGVLPEKELDTFHQDGTRLAGHPPVNTFDAIPFATGSLGHGLSLAAGFALSQTLRGTDAKTYCLTSDGEWQEGSTWEALIFACHHRLKNLTIAVDHNGLQGLGTTSAIASMDPLWEKMVPQKNLWVSCGSGSLPSV